LLFSGAFFFIKKELCFFCVQFISAQKVSFSAHVFQSGAGVGEALGGIRAQYCLSAKQLSAPICLVVVRE